MNITFLLPTFRHCFAGRAYVMLVTCKPVVVTLFLFVDTGAFNSTHSLAHSLSVPNPWQSMLRSRWTLESHLVSRRSVVIAGG